MAIENDILARNLKRYREACGLTQGELGDIAGVRTASISDIEGGKGDPKTSTLSKLARAMGVSLEALHRVSVESNIHAEVA